MKITEHFSLSEVEHSETAKRLGIDNSVPDGLISNVKRMCERLEQVRELFGQPIMISSFYRCPELNTKVGGSKTSAHMDGRACDFNVKWFNAENAFEKIKNSSIVIDQLIVESNSKGSSWVHFGIERDGEEPRKQYMIGKKSDSGSTFSRVERS